MSTGSLRNTSWPRSLPDSHADERSIRRTAGWLRAAGLIYGVHVVLLLFPPLPPDVKGSLWDYLSGYVAVALGWVGVARLGPRLADAWRSRPWSRRIVAVGTVAAFLLLFGLALRQISPDLFVRFSREEGAWEPLSLFLFGGTGILLFGVARGVSGVDRRFLSLFAWAYVLLAAEEVDYFGIFGGLVGRIEGVYAGSVHDLVHLGSEGLLSPLVAAILAGLAVAVAAGLVRRRYLQPEKIADVLGSRSGLWLLGGAVFVGVALAGEAHYVPLGDPSTEELLELAGTLFLAGFGLDVATRTLADRIDDQRESAGGTRADTARSRS